MTHSAVDQNGIVVDSLVQARRDRAAAERFFRHLISSAGTVPHTVVTDRLRSYCAALPRVLPKVKHRRGHWLNNRRKTPISQAVNGSDGCAGSSHPNRRSDFFPFTAPSVPISDPGGIASPRSGTEQYDGNVSSSGTRPCRLVRSQCHNHLQDVQGKLRSFANSIYSRPLICQYPLQRFLHVAMPPPVFSGLQRLRFATSPKLSCYSAPQRTQSPRPTP